MHEAACKGASNSEGFESAFGLELLATVDWVMQEQGSSDPSTIQQSVYAWGERKRRFTPAQIQLAASTLREEGLVSEVLRVG